MLSFGCYCVSVEFCCSSTFYLTRPRRRHRKHRPVRLHAAYVFHVPHDEFTEYCSPLGLSRGYATPVPDNRWGSTSYMFCKTNSWNIVYHLDSRGGTQHPYPATGGALKPKLFPSLSIPARQRTVGDIVVDHTMDGGGGRVLLQTHKKNTCRLYFYSYRLLHPLAQLAGGDFLPFAAAAF